MQGEVCQPKAGRGPGSTRNGAPHRPALARHAAKSSGWPILLVVLLGGSRASPAQPALQTIPDPVGDAVLRRMDVGANWTVDSFPTDIASISLGRWAPTNPQTDLYAGAYDAAGDFLKLEILVDGHFNPPGPLGLNGPYDPFRYGLDPIITYLELDLDANTATGGELDFPKFRFLGVAGRFGGLPSEPRFQNRAALDASAFDADITTAPYVDRSGEEFHLALLGEFITSVNKVVGNFDDTFELGETWILHGQLFHRAHGFENFSFATACGGIGAYMPVSELRFAHPTANDPTTLTMVYPVTQVGAAAMRGEAVQPLDDDCSNQHSVEEALDDLMISALWYNANPSGDPNEVIIIGWKDNVPQNHLNPAVWSAFGAFATAYADGPPDGDPFVWTDLVPDVVPGDVDGSGEVDAADPTAIQSFITAQDGGPLDADGIVNGRFCIGNFGPNFSVYDVNYDGYVDAGDVSAATVGPALSEWGMIVMTLALLAAGTVVVSRHRRGVPVVVSHNRELRRP